MSDAITILLSRIETLAVENLELQQANDAHKEDIEYMSGRLDSRNQEIDTLLDEIAALRSNLDCAERDKNALSRKCSNLEETLRQISNDKLPKLPDNMRDLSQEERKAALVTYTIACGPRDKIHCIKVVREKLGWGLKEAKEFVEAVPGACTGPISVSEEFVYR